MGMKKPGSSAVAEAQAPVTTAAKNTDSGTEAAVDRLNSAKAPIVSAPSKGRDFDAEAHGKTRCAAWCAAADSVALAGLKIKDMDALKKMIRELAEDGHNYSFGK